MDHLHLPVLSSPSGCCSHSLSCLPLGDKDPCDDSGPAWTMWDKLPIADQLTSSHNPIFNLNSLLPLKMPNSQAWHKDGEIFRSYWSAYPPFPCLSLLLCLMSLSSLHSSQRAPSEHPSQDPHSTAVLGKVVLISPIHILANTEQSCHC